MTDLRRYPHLEAKIERERLERERLRARGFQPLTRRDYQAVIDRARVARERAQRQDPPDQVPF